MSSSVKRTCRRSWGCYSEEGFVDLVDDRWHWMHESYPADAVSLRSVSSDNFVVVDVSDQTTIIGEVDFSAATSTLYEQAIYLVEGTQYQVERLDCRSAKGLRPTGR